MVAAVWLLCERQYNVELLNVGGNANNGAHCGLANSNSNNDFSNSNTNIGARLKFFIYRRGSYSIPFPELRSPLHWLRDDRRKVTEHTFAPCSMEEV